MSMFYELMMRKKEEIMYATIKGTLTENDGVFSGFSSSSYLQIQNAININSSTNFEMVVKVNFNNFTENSTFVGSFNRYDITLRTGTNGKVYLNAGNGNSWIFVNEESTNAFLLNTDYYFKIVLKSNKAQVFSSTNGTNWVKEIEKTFIIVSQYNFKITLGIGRISTTYFEGSIDLPNSYIKLGSTKYNLQAVVGYTVVGSPTITDGVVSGFSGSDYLYILSPKSVPTEIQSNNMKIKIKIKTPEQWSTSNMFLIGFNHSVSSDSATLYDGGLYITTAGNLTIHTAIINSLQPYIPLELDTIYYIEIETKGVFKIGISQDNVNWTYIQKDIYRDKWYLRNRSIRIGRAGTALGQEFNGEIFISETNFVINNKLWFNGQQA